MRNDGTHIASVREAETACNLIFRVWLRLRSSWYTWWNKRKFRSVGEKFYAPGPISVVNGRRITIGDNVFLGERCQLYAFPTSEMQIGNHTSIDRYVEIRGGLKIDIGNHVRIARGATLKTTDKSNMSVGDRTLISQGCILDAEFTIGQDVMLAPHVFINGYDHGHNAKDIPMRIQEGISAPVQIEDDVWIGCNAVLLKGVTVGKGAIVGANAVASKSVPAYSIHVGNPARHLKYRGEE